MDDDIQDCKYTPTRKQHSIMVRPPWNWITKGSAGVYACSCGQSLWSREAVREHWQKGHMDVVCNPGQEVIFE